MLRDVFYYGAKPNVHPREKFAESLEDARNQCTTEHFWIINEFSDYRNFDWDFDFEFLPDEDVWAEEHNNVWPSQHQKDSGTWLCPKEFSAVVIYRGDVEPVRRKNLKSDNWVELDLIDSSFDFSWHPDPTAPPYIYKWGCKFFPVQIKSVLEYHTPGATEVKYMTSIVELLPEEDKWIEVQAIDKHKFDMSWRPNPLDPPFIYVWGNKWINGTLKSTLEYHMPGATDRKYMPEKITVLPELDRWKILKKIDESSFDFTWRPDPREPPMTYVFGNQWYDAGKMPTIMYTMTEGHDIKYMDEFNAKLANDSSKYEHLEDAFLDDYSWIPDPDSPPYIYAWGNQWNKPEDKISIQYIVPGATEYKYIENRATRLPSMKNWLIPDSINTEGFDLSWEPDPYSPPYIYQFATLLDDIWVDDGPKYITPGNDGLVVRLENSILHPGKISYPKYMIETTLADLIKEHPTEMFWALNRNINYDEFDFDWIPEKEDLFNVTVFGSPDSETTHTYFVNAKYYLEGYTGFKFIEEDTTADDSKYLAKLFKKPDVFYVDRNNPESSVRFEQLKSRFGNKIQKTRYLNSWVDTINRCINRSTTDLIWILNSELDYSDFDFDYYPNPWQMEMVHVFGTQWSHWGTTFMVNRETFPVDTKYIKIVEHLSNLNFVKHIRAKAKACVHDVIMIDHSNTDLNAIINQIERKIGKPVIATVKYDESYLNTFRNFVKTLPEKKEHYLWACSSICDYAQFDFTYICDPFAKDNLHVFPSGAQKFGDTFLIDVNKTKSIIDDIEKLEEYNKVNFNSTIRTDRLLEPVIITTDDTHVDSINKVTDFPYATILTSDNAGMDKTVIEPMNLWSSDTKNIIITSTGATRIVVPREAKYHVKNELYDYPYIKRAARLTKSRPLDIIFLSNGETGADENWEYLQKITKGLPNRVIRVDGVNGRVAAYHAAATASETPWCFTVFAKLHISAKFDFNWQPDRMQIPKHYIFHAKNPVNGLVYGHQAMIAYNKRLTLTNEGQGLDFTLDDAHEVIPLISGTAKYNTDPFSTWRTAFREVLKLKVDDTDISRERLDAWLNKAEGDYSEFSIKGALDADEYYDEVSGDFEKLKLSYEWAWLRQRFDQI